MAAAFLDSAERPAVWSCWALKRLDFLLFEFRREAVPQGLSTSETHEITWSTKSRAFALATEAAAERTTFSIPSATALLWLSEIAKASNSSPESKAAAYCAARRYPKAIAKSIAVPIPSAPPRIKYLILHLNVTSVGSNSRICPEACGGGIFASFRRDDFSAILCRFGRLRVGGKEYGRHLPRQHRSPARRP
jgi:hypothetical protein